MADSVYKALLQKSRQQGGGFLLLLDPDRIDSRTYLLLAESATDSGVDALLVGTSFMLDSTFHEAVRDIKAHTRLPVILFPGSHAQLVADADAVLFTSLISGRNPQYLIDEQVKGAPLVKRFGLESIPTGYMLIDSGTPTSVQFISDTRPIPSDKTDIAAAHAMAAECLGMKLVYLEAGSGAEFPVNVEMISTVTRYVDIPVMVGGGLRTPEQCAARIRAGASFVVVGNQLERSISLNQLKELTDAVRGAMELRS